MGKQSHTGHVPVGLAGPGGFPWSRLVIGLIALVLSATVSWRAVQPASEVARKEVPAVPVQQARTAPRGLQPIPAPPQPAALAQETAAAAAVPAEIEQDRQPATSPAPAQLQRASIHTKPQPRRHSRRRTGATVASSRQVARTRLASGGVASAQGRRSSLHRS